MKFIYDPMDMRIAKVEYLDNPHTRINYTYYSYDASGNVMATYERLINPDRDVVDGYIDEVYLQDHSIYGSSRIGVENNRVRLARRTFTITGDVETGINPTYGSPTQDNYEYTYRKVSDKNYELSNHLGNVLAVVTDRKIAYVTTNNPTIYTADVVSYSDYSPYGTLLHHRHGQESTTDYRYGFQGQEADDELKGEGNSYNYTFRMHDPRIGRFFAIDPLTSKYPWYTPYQFSGNRPIDCVELEGLEEKKVGKVGANGAIPRSLWHMDPTSALTAGFINALVDDVVGLAFLGKIAASLDPSNYFFYTTEGSNVRGEAWEMLKTVSLIMTYPHIQKIVIDQALDDIGGTVKGMDVNDWCYTVGYTGWQVVSLFIGVGEISALIKSGKFASELPKMVKAMNFIEDVVVVPERLMKGHLTQFSKMTKAERKAFQHSYNRHEKELELPEWQETKAEELRKSFNNKVSEIREAGKDNFFQSTEWYNSKRVTVNRTEPVINGQRYFYYETLDGKFISSGKMP